MSGVELKTAREAAEASIGSDGKRTYTAKYLARMDAASDGPAAVLDFLEERNIYPDVPYSYNGDTDVNAFCNGITPRRVTNSVEWWDVTVQYGPKSEGDKQDQDGKPTDNPDNWQWQHTMGYSTWQEAVWKAYNVTAFPHPESLFPSTFIRPALKWGPVVNSANVVLDPPLMRDLFDRVWQITAFSQFYNGATSDLYMGCINHDTVTYHPKMRSTFGIKPATYYQYQVKCTNASATHRILVYRRQRIPYWEWTWEFRFRRPNWLEEVLDRGLSSLPEAGMPTGKTNSPNDIDDIITRGRAPTIPVTDAAGRRVPELQLFDGAGCPMLPLDPKSTEGYYFSWQKDNIADFRYPTLPFKFFS